MHEQRDDDHDARSDRPSGHVGRRPAARRRSSGCTAGPDRVPVRRRARPDGHARPVASRSARRVGRPARAGAGRLLRDRHRRRRVRHARPGDGAVGVGGRRGGQGQQPVPHLQPPGDVGRHRARRDARRACACTSRGCRRLAIPLVVLAGLAMALPFVPGRRLDASTTPGPGSRSARSACSRRSSSSWPSSCSPPTCWSAAQDELSDVRRSLRPIALVAMGAAGACLAQGDLGSAIVMCAIVLAVAFIGGVPLSPMLATGAGGGRRGARLRVLDRRTATTASRRSSTSPGIATTSRTRRTRASCRSPTAA